jgi:hypothetical protein
MRRIVLACIFFCLAGCGSSDKQPTQEQIVKRTVDSMNAVTAQQTAAVELEKRNKERERQAEEEAIRRGSDLRTIRNEIVGLTREFVVQKDRLERIKEVVLLRSSTERERQIRTQVEIIQNIEMKIEELREIERKIHAGQKYDLENGYRIGIDSIATGDQ